MIIWIWAEMEKKKRRRIKLSEKSSSGQIGAFCCERTTFQMLNNFRIELADMHCA